MRINFTRKILQKVLMFWILICLSACADTLTDNSFGNVIIGMEEASAKKILTGYVTDEEIYDQPYNCHYLTPPESKEGVSFMVIDQKIVRFDVYNKELNIATEEGVGIGSSKSDILKVYRNAEVSPHPYIAPEGEYIEAKLSNGNGIIFETEHDVVTSFRLGSYPAVEYIEGCL